MRDLYFFIRHLLIKILLSISYALSWYRQTYIYMQFLKCSDNTQCKFCILALKFILLIYCSILAIFYVKRLVFYPLAVLLAVLNILYFIIKTLVEEELYLNTFMLDRYFISSKATSEEQEKVRAKLRAVVTRLTLYRMQIRTYYTYYMLFSSGTLTVYFILSWYLN